MEILCWSDKYLSVIKTQLFFFRLYKLLYSKYSCYLTNKYVKHIKSFVFDAFHIESSMSIVEASKTHSVDVQSVAMSFEAFHWHKPIWIWLIDEAAPSMSMAIETKSSKLYVLFFFWRNEIEIRILNLIYNMLTEYIIWKHLLFWSYFELRRRIQIKPLNMVFSFVVWESIFSLCDSNQFNSVRCN